MIYFIRHGESEANLKHIFAGQRDNSPLTPKGETQAKEEGEKIKEMGLKFNKIISSPLIRAKETARIVSEVIGYTNPIIIDSRITEYDMGSLTGTPTRDISSKILVTAEKAEDPQNFSDRVHSALSELNQPGENILIVAHAGVGRIIEAKREGMEPSLFYDLKPYPNAAVVALDWLN